jgi:hypothetical protein
MQTGLDVGIFELKVLRKMPTIAPGAVSGRDLLTGEIADHKGTTDEI